jgi:hypothetical protein
MLRAITNPYQRNLPPARTLLGDTNTRRSPCRRRMQYRGQGRHGPRRAQESKRKLNLFFALGIRCKGRVSNPDAQPPLRASEEGVQRPSGSRAAFQIKRACRCRLAGYQRLPRSPRSLPPRSPPRPPPPPPPPRPPPPPPWPPRPPP